MKCGPSLLELWTISYFSLFALVVFDKPTLSEAFVGRIPIHARSALPLPTRTRKRHSLIRLAPTDWHISVSVLTETFHSSAILSHNSQSWIALLPPPPFWLKASWDFYRRLLQEEPVQTKAATAAVLGCLGDGVAQWKSGENSYSYRRGLAFLLFGALYTGAFQHHWFQFLQQNVAEWGENVQIWGHPAETNIPVQQFIEQRPEWWQYFDMTREIDRIMDTLQDPPSSLELALAKVALNQFLVVPGVYMPLFFLITGAVAGLDRNQIVARARSLYVPLLKRNYLFWLPIQTFQFAVVPSDYQVPFVCVASLCWTIILSSIGGSSTPPASPSSIVAYYQEEATESEGIRASASAAEPNILVMPVDAGAANEVTDEVLWEDVRDTFVPKDVRNVVGDVQEALVNNPQVGAGAGGLALGLLASAVDEAAIGTTLGAALGASPDLGIAVVAAVGASAGYFASKSIKTEPSTTTSDEGATRSISEKVDSAVLFPMALEERSKPLNLGDSSTSVHIHEKDDADSPGRRDHHEATATSQSKESITNKSAS